MKSRTNLTLALVAMLAAVPITAHAQAQAPDAQAAATAPLSVEVMRMGEGSLNVNISLIEGERDAVLVDVPFTRADAHRVAAMVLDSGKNLTHIFVTHDHPDHFFAMEVLQQVFPDARIVAHPTVVEDIWRSLPFKVKRWSPMLGANAPVHPTAPAPLNGDTIMLEGQPLKVIGPVQGDHLHATALWVPSIRALFAGDLVFNEMHLWLGEHDPEQVAAWRASLDTLEALEPEVVVAGHARPGMPNDASGIAFSKAYLDAWQELAPQADNSEQLRAQITTRFPDTIDALGDFILGNSSKVATGEMAKWVE